MTRIMDILPDPITYRYDGPLRITLLPDGGEQPEDLIEFLQRMKLAKDLLWNDLERADKEVPLFDEARRNRKNIKQALEGIAAGGGMKKVTRLAGFPYWGDFETFGIRRAPCIRRLYELAKEERALGRLNDAEDALYERAVEGVDEPIINHLGQIIGSKKKYSDSLLALQLKALNPRKYADRGNQVAEGLVVHVNMDLAGNGSVKSAQEVEEVAKYNGMASYLDDAQSDASKLGLPEPDDDEL